MELEKWTKELVSKYALNGKVKIFTGKPLNFRRIKMKFIFIPLMILINCISMIYGDPVSPKKIGFSDSLQSSLLVTNAKIYWSPGRLDKTLFLENLAKKNEYKGSSSIQSYEIKKEDRESYTGTYRFKDGVLNYSFKGYFLKYSFKAKNSAIKGEFEFTPDYPPAFALVNNRFLFVANVGVSPDSAQCDCTFFDTGTGQRVDFEMDTQCEIKKFYKFRNVDLIIFGKKTAGMGTLDLPEDNYVLFNEKRNAFFRLPMAVDLIDTGYFNSKIFFLGKNGILVLNPDSGNCEAVSIRDKIVINKPLPVYFSIYSSDADPGLTNIQFTELKKGDAVKAYYYLTDDNDTAIIEIETSKYQEGLISNNINFYIISNEGQDGKYITIPANENGNLGDYFRDKDGNIIYQKNRNGVYPLMFPVIESASNVVAYAMNRGYIKVKKDDFEITMDRTALRLSLEDPAEAVLTGDYVAVRRIEFESFKDWDKTAEESKNYTQYYIASVLVKGDKVLVIAEKGKWSYVYDEKNKVMGWIYNKYLKTK